MPEELPEEAPVALPVEETKPVAAQCDGLNAAQCPATELAQAETKVEQTKGKEQQTGIVEEPSTLEALPEEDWEEELKEGEEMPDDKKLAQEDQELGVDPAAEAEDQKAQAEAPEADEDGMAEGMEEPNKAEAVENPEDEVPESEFYAEPEEMEGQAPAPNAPVAPQVQQ